MKFTTTKKIEEMIRRKKNEIKFMRMQVVVEKLFSIYNGKKTIEQQQKWNKNLKI